MTNHTNSAKAASQQFSKKQNSLIWVSLLIGLIGLVGLIYRQGTIPAQAAGAQPAGPAKTAPTVPLNSVQAQAPITPVDVVVVFDASGSTEDQTVCHDCWVRTNYGPDYPNNGYFNPIPYEAKLAPGAANQSIPLSRLCTDPSRPWLQDNGGTIYQYLTLEAELYSANVGDWSLEARIPGQGFWAIQRGSRGPQFPAGFEGTADEAAFNQGNQAGQPDHQSSNVCSPTSVGGINCTVNGGDNVCNDDPGSDIVRDCSAYISARPFGTYNQSVGSFPTLSGASYNLDCFKTGAGPFNPISNPVLSGRCWTDDRTTDNPFIDFTGPGPSNVPWVEYDFTPTWTQTTYLWVRAIGGNRQSYTWAGNTPDDLDSTPNDNVRAWRKVIFWQIDQGGVSIQNDNSNAAVQVLNPNDFRDNRAVADSWRWVKLGPISTTTLISGTQHTFKIYQGSAGYKIDKIIFTDDPNGASASPPPAMRRDLTGGTVITDSRLAFGPPASYGSASREACNLCNPIYGYTVDQTQCSCLRNNTEASRRYLPGFPGYDPSFYGTGPGCSLVPGGITNLLTHTIAITVSPPGMQPPQIQTRTVVNDLYAANQPIRSAQEAVKHFVLGNGVEEKYRLKPGFDQVGFVPLAANTVITADRRSKLQCLRSQNLPAAAAATCYAATLSVVEQQWATGGTNMAEGLSEAMEELGLSVSNNNGVDSSCSDVVDDKHACDRSGAARRVIILITDGNPNIEITNCQLLPGYADYWKGLVGHNDDNFDCAMWYAQQAAAAGIMIYTISLGNGANADYLTTMATGTDPLGGLGSPQFMFNAQCGQYFAAAKPSDLDAIFKTILSQIRNCVPNVPILSLTNSDTTDPVLAGKLLTYTLAVTNYDGIAATNAVITAALDNKVGFASASAGGTYAAGIVTWNVGDIPLFQSITRTLIVTVANISGSGILTNTAWLISAEGAGQSRTVTTTVVNPSSITPPTNLLISGPSSGITNTVYTFTASVNPLTTTLPLTYAWQADGQVPLTHLSGLSDPVTFSWNTPGAKRITTTVTNAAGAITTSHNITLGNCQSPLQNKSFETIGIWGLANSEGVVFGPGGHTGSRQLLAHSFNAAYRQPFFYQKFQLPPKLLVTTTLKLNFFYQLNNLSDGDDLNDKYYAVIATSPNLSATLVTTPVEIVNGDVPPDGVSAPPNTTLGWVEKTLNLPLTGGINLNNYAGQDLYLYIYNKSNATTPTCPSPGCHISEFSFDDVDLTICTFTPNTSVSPIYMPIILKN